MAPRPGAAVFLTFSLIVDKFVAMSLQREGGAGTLAAPLLKGKSLMYPPAAVESSRGIPVRDKRRGTIIGFCKKPPLKGGLTLPVFRPSLHAVAGDVPDIVRVHLAYDEVVKCYWADGYDCLLTDCVDYY